MQSSTLQSEWLWQNMVWCASENREAWKCGPLQRSGTFLHCKLSVSRRLWQVKPYNGEDGKCCLLNTYKPCRQFSVQKKTNVNYQFAAQLV
jgi:hypothetical protein